MRFFGSGVQSGGDLSQSLSIVLGSEPCQGQGVLGLQLDPRQRKGT